MLREAGIPLAFDAEGPGHHIPGNGFLRPTSFTPPEALALMVLCHELGGEQGLPLYRAARSAALKLESSLPLRLRQHLREMGPSVQINLQQTNQLLGSEEVFELLLEAVALKRCVRIEYDSLTEWKLICTKLHAYQLLFSRHSWYVIGRSSMHRATRTFNVGRIRQIELLDESLSRPASFRLERYLRNAWHLIPESGVDQKVVVRFKKMVAQNVAEVTWHKTQRVTHRRDGSIDYRVTVSGLGEISWWIQGYGDQAEVLRPQKLRDLIATRCRNLLALYEGSTPPAKSTEKHRSKRKRKLAGTTRPGKPR